MENFLSEYVHAKSKILDWGGDTGLNTPFRGSHNNIDIFDISNKNLLEGMRRVDLSNIKNKTDYDLICSIQVFEHLPYPLQALSKIVQLMKPGAFLYLEVPHEKILYESDDSYDSHLNKFHWHEHINFFTVESIRKLFELSGLTLIKIHTLVVNK